MKKEKKLIINIALSVVILLNIVFLKFIWFEYNELYLADGFKNADGLSYLGTVGRNGFYMMGIILMVLSVWLINTIDEIISPVIISIIGACGFIASFFTASPMGYNEFHSISGNHTSVYTAAMIFGVISTIGVLADVTVQGWLRLKKLKRDKK